MAGIRQPYQGDPRQRSKDAKYTKGGELMLNGENYIGPYHIYGNARYTGEEHDTFSELLTPFIADKNIAEYINNTTADFQPLVPTFFNYFTPQPKQENYDAGYLVRYFAQKLAAQDAIVYEIPQDVYRSRQDLIDLGLYGVVELSWKLTGPIRSQIVRNRLGPGVVQESKIIGIFDYNREQVLKASATLPGLATSIVDYVEFARPTALNPQFEVTTGDVVLSELPASVDTKLKQTLRRR